MNDIGTRQGSASPGLEPDRKGLGHAGETYESCGKNVFVFSGPPARLEREVMLMSSLARPVQTRPRERVHPRPTVEAVSGPRRTASRAEIRSLLAHGPEGPTVERFEMSETGVLVREAALLWWGAQTPTAAIDDEQYPGD